ncbi:MAG TPA: hypothetical protein PLS03_11565 [Terrimicrobiaceae bacterium]|nr:hypothetical protein [Terrimicrobiaceae bacterium]
MNRSEINALLRASGSCSPAHSRALLPRPRRNVTDFGRGVRRRRGLLLVNPVEEPERGEKLMSAHIGRTTPAHAHRQKKDEIISLWGRLAARVWNGYPARARRISEDLP